MIAARHPTGLAVLTQIDRSVDRVTLHPASKPERESGPLVGLGTLKVNLIALHPALQVTDQSSPQMGADQPFTLLFEEENVIILAQSKL